MRFLSSLIPVALTVLSALSSVTAHNIQLGPHSKECFFEQLHRDDRMTVSFQVGDREFGGAGNLDIDFWIQDPAGTLLAQHHATPSGDHSFTAALDGRYTYCFSNEAYSGSNKEVSFNVHGIVYVPEPPPGSPGADPLEHEVRQLSELLATVKDEQEYIVLRERVHRNTAESTNSRVKWWSMFQLIVVIGVGAFQIWWVKRFFEVKRVV